MIGFQILYPELTNVIFEEERVLAEYVLLMLRARQLEKGYIASKIFTANRKGLKIRYELVTDPVVIEEEFQRIITALKDVEDRIKEKIEKGKLR